MSAHTASSFTGLSVQASHSLRGGDINVPQFVEIVHRAPTEEEATAFAAQFPKSYGFKVLPVGGKLPSGDHGTVYWTVSTRTNLLPKVGNEKNEAGIKRYRSIAAKADKLGIPFVFDKVFTNGYATREEFESAIS